VRQNPRKDIGPAMTLRGAGGQSPNFVGGGTAPYLVRSAEGMNGNQAGFCGQNCGYVFSDISVATDLSCVMEAVNSAVAIYRASTGALVYGPYSGASYFAPVKQTDSFVLDLQTHYDTSRDRWVVIATELIEGNTPTGDAHGYIDIAVSMTNSPTQPSSGAQYYEYQFSADLQPTAGEAVCLSATLGMDYWGLYIGCTMEDTSSGFFGNDLLAIPKAGFYSGTSSAIPYWDNIAACPPNSCISPPFPNAYRISPALEDGTPDAE
jgi:hypothetical protein